MATREVHFDWFPCALPAHSIDIVCRVSFPRRTITTADVTPSRRPQVGGIVEHNAQIQATA